MKNNIILAILSVFSVLAFAMVPATTTQAAPVDVLNSVCKTNPKDPLCTNNSSGVFSIVRSVIQVLLVVSGIVSVIMIIIGGIKYTTSNGEAAQVKSAKDTILYAIIGLVVSIGGFAIVTWVVGQL